MRILHLDSGREMRGGQWQVLRLHRGLAARGFDSVLLARGGSPLLARARAEGLPCEALTPWRAAGRCDLVHAHDARSHSLAALLARAPLVVARRVAFPVRDSMASRWKYRRAALFLAVSRFVAGELARAGVPEGKIVVVYDGVPIPEHPAAGSAAGSTILVLDTADPAKGRALAESAAARAGVTVRRTADLEADLPQARALVYLSKSEGLGSGILLAMAHGVTVIASNVGGIPELIQDGVNGILVPNEESAVAAALARLDPGFGPSLGNAARETVARRFSEPAMIEATIAAYRKVLAC